jgi:hypothetical protein
MSERASSQWKAMSDAEKAVCAILVKVADERLTDDLADRNIMTQRKMTLLPGVNAVRQSHTKSLEKPFGRLKGKINTHRSPVRFTELIG